MFEFSFHLSEQDYAAFNLYTTTTGALGKRNLNSFRIIFPLISLLAIFCFILSDADIGLIIAESIALGIMSVLFLCFSKKIFSAFQNSNVTRLAKKGKLPFDRDGYFRFEDDCFHEVTDKTDFAVKYCAVERIGLNTNAIYLYTGMIQGYIIPFISFADENEKNHFLSFIVDKAETARMTQKEQA